jgi:hypothetical protein
MHALHALFNQAADANRVVREHLTHNGGFGLTDLSLLLGGECIDLGLAELGLAVDKGLVGLNPFSEGGVHSLFKL